MELKWTENDSETGERRHYEAQRHGRSWRFRAKIGRRGENSPIEPTRDHWESVLEIMLRKYQRRDGVDETDLAEVERILEQLPDKPAFDENE